MKVLAKTKHSQFTDQNMGYILKISIKKGRKFSSLGKENKTGSLLKIDEHRIENNDFVSIAGGGKIQEIFSYHIFIRVVK